MSNINNIRPDKREPISTPFSLNYNEILTISAKVVSHLLAGIKKPYSKGEEEAEKSLESRVKKQTALDRDPAPLKTNETTN